MWGARWPPPPPTLPPPGGWEQQAATEPPREWPDQAADDHHGGAPSGLIAIPEEDESIELPTDSSCFGNLSLPGCLHPRGTDQASPTGSTSPAPTSEPTTCSLNLTCASSPAAGPGEPQASDGAEAPSEAWGRCYQRSNFLTLSLAAILHTLVKSDRGSNRGMGGAVPTS